MLYNLDIKNKKIVILQIFCISSYPDPVYKLPYYLLCLSKCTGHIECQHIFCCSILFMTKRYVKIRSFCLNWSKNVPSIYEYLHTLVYIVSASANFSVRMRLLPSVLSRSASSLSAAEGGPFFWSWKYVNTVYCTTLSFNCAEGWTLHLKLKNTL